MNDSLTYLRLEDAATAAPGRPHKTTIYRWIIDGRRARNGEIIRLRHLKAGGVIYTTEQWLREFFEALTAMPDDDEPRDRSAPKRRGRPKLRGREARRRRAKRELERAGI